MSYSIGSREQENNSLTNIWFGPIQARIQLPNQIEPAIDLIVDKARDSTLIVMDWYQDRVLDKQT
ncbi:hypothetical protein C4D60_Mb00t15000 [Musa balbisiana]|uniref:Uncharacterized protein n=1 Tax=Musa balbisiana TaxID=52838 RepID=A0A4S8I2Z0_MUSBA|nr:hypothetical protein C4D60_Mb00t15000 [Musa balbisiana]